MIVRVVPLTRLPKGLSFFDYTVPETLAKDVRVGQLITVPFRASQTFGVVFGFVEEKTLLYDRSRIKQMEHIVQTEPFFSRQHLAIAEMASTLYGASMGVIIKMMMPPLQKRKLQNLALLPFVDAVNKKTEPIYHGYSGDEERIKMLEQYIAPSGQTLVLLPELCHLEELLSLLPERITDEVVVWHSGLSQKDQFNAWEQIRNNEKKIIVGTRSAIFLPFYDLQSIVVDFEHHEQHKHWDQIPRFHAKDMAEFLHDVWDAPVVFAGFSPSVEAVHRFQLTQRLLSPKLLPTIVDMRSERTGSQQLLSLRLEQAIRDTDGDVFIFLNRRGFARHVECRDCGLSQRCPSCDLPLIYHEGPNILRCHYCHHEAPLSLTCPRCHSVNIVKYGGGTQLLETSIKKIISDLPHAIYRIDSDSDELPKDILPEQHRIIIGTEKALPKIRWSQTKLIILIQIDQQLSLPEYRAEEHVWHLFHEIAFRASPTCAWYIQTMNPEYPLFQELAAPHQFYERTLAIRQRLHYPPFSYLVKYFYGGSTARDAEEAAQQLFITLLPLTNQPKQLSMTGPFEMHPRYFRGKFWYAILIRLSSTHWQQELRLFNEHVGPAWKIDPNPISILSP